MTRRISPDEAVDRDLEQETFRVMLQFPDDARLLLVEDGPGTGKSTLLARLRYNCRIRPRIPVSLVLLEEAPDVPGRSSITNPLELVSWIRHDLGASVPFPLFDVYDTLRDQYRSVPFTESLDKLRSQVGDLYRQAPIEIHGRIDLGEQRGGTATAVNIENLNYGERSAWPSPGQQRTAELRCVQAFIADLRKICRDRIVVLMFDNYESRHPGIGDWLIDDFITPLLLEDDPADKLLVVLATADHKDPPLKEILGDDLDRLVRPGPFFATWERDHVRQFLDVHGYTNLSDYDFGVVCDKIRSGVSLSAALSIAGTLRKASEGLRRKAS